MSDDRSVFGISVDPLKDRFFGFVKVEAIVEERRLRTDFDPTEEFPTEGNIYVGEAFLRDPYTGAIWRVRRGDAPHPRPRHAEWSAVSRGVPGPLEVISLPLSSSHGNRVKQQLLEGLELGYIPASQILVRLLDGVIIGPILANGYDKEGALGFASSSDSFAESLRVWEQASLDTFQVEAPYALDRRRRTFLCDIDLPAAQRWIDLADFGDTVKSILKPLASGEGRLLTSGLLREIASALRADDHPEAIRERVNRVRRAVQSLAITTEELEGLMPAVLANPEVAKAIQDARQNAAEEERRRIAAERQGAVDEIRRLRDQEQRLKERIDSLSQELADVQQSMNNAADVAADEVRSRVQEAMSSAEKLLADVAILRPFLSLGVSVPPERHERPEVMAADPARVVVRPIRLRKDVEEIEESEPATASDLTTRLAGDLKAGGIAPNASRLLAREVMAAWLTGQVLVLTGSFANPVAEILARAAAGSRAVVAEIPLGLISDSPLRGAVDAALGAADELQRVLVLSGIDRSAVEVYGGVLRDTIASRVLTNDFEDVPLAFIASACGGPACLPIGPGVFDLGPVVDTDLLAYSKKGGGRAPLRRAVSRKRWSEWRCELLKDRHEAQNDARTACLQLSVAGSMLWRKGAETAAAYLAALCGPAETEVAGSVLARWIVPRALAEGLSPDDIMARLNALGIDEKLTSVADGAELPIAALLEKARRILMVGR